MPPKKKRAASASKAEPFEVDPRSDRIVLAYVGENDRSARNAPPRALTENDLARLAYVEALAPIAEVVGQPVYDDKEIGDGDPADHIVGYVERPDPRDPDSQLVGEIVAELVASEYFTTDEGAIATAEDKRAAIAARSAKPAPSDVPDEPPTTTEPDAPAPKPEG
jgi:hypothetical protein